MDAKKTTLCKHRARTSNSPNQSLPHPLGLKGLLLSDLLLTLKDKKSRMWQLRVPQTSSAAALGRNRPLSTVHRSACVNDRIRCRSSKLGDAPTIALRDEPVPLSADGVYAVYDESKTLQYVGMSRQVAASLAAHVQDLPERAVFARVRAVPGGAKAELQQAWKEWIIEHGAMPPGNAKGCTDWTAAGRGSGAAAKPAAVAAAAAAPARPTPEQLRGKVARCANPTALDIITPQVLEQLLTTGVVVLDGVLPQQQVEAARHGADALHAAGCLIPVSQQRNQGRLDEILVMDEVEGKRLVARSGPGSSAGSSSGKAAAQEALASEACAGLASVAAFMKGLPHALMQRQAQRQAGQGAGSSKAGEWAMPELAVPENLMLAIYPGGGAYYATHKDNDTPADEVAPPPGGGGAAWAGPPGQRVRDRAVTALLYLNDPNWSIEADGGCLRVYSMDGSGAYQDVAPLGGRLVLFQSRALEHEVLPAFRPRWALSAWIPSLEAFSQ